jgi:hypothetical protein
MFYIRIYFMKNSEGHPSRHEQAPLVVVDTLVGGNREGGSTTLSTDGVVGGHSIADGFKINTIHASLAAVISYGGDTFVGIAKGFTQEEGLLCVTLLKKDVQGMFAPLSVDGRTEARFLDNKSPLIFGAGPDTPKRKRNYLESPEHFSIFVDNGDFTITDRFSVGGIKVRGFQTREQYLAENPMLITPKY